MIPTPPPSRRPVWFIAILVVLALPLLGAPSLINRLSDENGLLLAFPLYVILSLYLAYASWPTRSYVSWILVAVLILSYISLFILI